MIFYDYYADIPEQTLRDFVTRQDLGRLVTVSAEGQPHIGLYPFVFLGDTVELHLQRADEQLADLRTNSLCAFECQAEQSEDVEVLAAQQQRLMAHYQPDGGHKPVTTEHAMYRGPLGTLTALTLQVRARKVKWKLAQNRGRKTREKVIANLRER